MQLFCMVERIAPKSLLRKRSHGEQVLVSGLNGLGCEIAKNVLLGGVKSMTIHDTKPTTLWDLSSQYYLTEKDVGRCPSSSQQKYAGHGR